MTTDTQLNVAPPPIEAPTMFSKESRQHRQGRVIIVGRPSRKAARVCLNTPITTELHRRLRDRIEGSISMGSAALLEWALDELETRNIAIQARLNA